MRRTSSPSPGRSLLRFRSVARCQPAASSPRWRSPGSPGSPGVPSVFIDAHKLPDDALALRGVVTANGGRDTALQVIVEQQDVDAIDSTLHRLQLLDHVHAIDI